MIEQQSEADYSSLRRNVSYLGTLLGEAIAAAEGPEVLERVETIRRSSKAAREGNGSAGDDLLQALQSLETHELVPVARAFSQFLNLANIADQHHTVSREMDPWFSASATLADCLNDLQQSGVEGAEILRVVEQLKIELVLTAHPTEITRRTLIHKHAQINQCLSQLELEGYTPREEQRIHKRLQELIAQVWYGYDFRQERPSPVDEAKWGLAVVEESLWRAVPEFLRRLDTAVEAVTGSRLPVTAAPVRFYSWMGSDRDGNPNVTAEVTREVLLLSRWQAADLYLRDVEELIDELSMTRCDDALRDFVGDAHEPYRAALRPLRDLLRVTLDSLGAMLAGEEPEAQPVLERREQLWEPLHLCYQSMLNCGMEAIASGTLLDLLRRLRCFGIFPLRHDVRQHSDRHIAVLSELTQWLGLGDYAEWSEHQRREFLLQELASRRPLIGGDWTPSDEVAEVLASCELIASQPAEALGVYVISMARAPSDVLAVHLLLQESGCKYPLPVVPLFETLDDLSNAAETVTRLLDIDWYREHIAGAMMVMIGYSDSAKDAGVMAASWAQYCAQESLLAVCTERDVELMLFHGRGGTIGRGGMPAHEALLSQPPGSLRNGLRVTEQGEMIRTKLGLTSLAVKTLALYTSAILKANLQNPPEPLQHWRAMMDQLSASSCASYRALVRDHPDFVAYFRYATPEPELSHLTMGSRPARRPSKGDKAGIESLRAIPWIFAWTQNRLMLPAWLGAGEALRLAVEQGSGDLLQEMIREWPFFATRLSMLEMVFAKADANLSAYYDRRLVPAELHHLGAELRAQMSSDVDTVLSLLGKETLLEGQDWLRESIQLRNIYTDPLNVLQAELLLRQREREDDSLTEAVMVTIAGVAAGMRNTG